jgi:uncharacterized protein
LGWDIEMTNEMDASRRVQDGLMHLRNAIAPFVATNMAARYGDKWPHYASRAAGSSTNTSLDAYALLKTIIDNWRDIFANGFEQRIGVKVRNHVSNSLDGRNAVSHLSIPLTDAEALRYLDAMLELAQLVKGPEKDISAIKALYAAQRTGGVASAAPVVPIPSAPTPDMFAQTEERVNQLRPWISVALPHPDVLASRFREAEFAADLFAVDAGNASDEYTIPENFFRITFLTDGLRRVLANALTRLSGTGGDPIIGLQTAFGGGKTHTMLALYHLGRARDLSVLHGIMDMSEATAIGGGWKAPKVACFVGTSKGTDTRLVLKDGPAVHTLWGYLAWRLAGDEGLALVQEAENARTNPGSEIFLEVLRLAGPCIILLDEVVAYARQLQDDRFEAFLSFIQSLTEAVKMAPNALLIGSLPESETEAGGERGAQALIRLQKVFGRTQSAWLPASGDETYEIIRRRLFQELDSDGEKARDETVKAFAKMYRDSKAEFPGYAAEPRYAELMKLSYPIHPELFDRLSKDWSTLDKFQRTRGVLSFMANVIGTLWQEQAGHPMILPGRVPVANERVRARILQPLDPLFGPVVDKEVDGISSLPAQKEADPKRRISRARAATRAARSVFLCSAPLVGNPNAGLNGQGLRLACAEPGDQLAIFGDALRELSEQSAYLYEEAGRYWYSTKPTLGRLAEERARAFEDHKVNDEIQKLLDSDAGKKGGFDRVHAVPGEARNIDEAIGISLVILPPAVSHSGKATLGSTACDAAIDGLLHCRNGQRKRRNLLVFVAADEALLASARQSMRRAMAWAELASDRQTQQTLNQAQTENMNASAKTSREGADKAVRDAWSHILTPIREPDEVGGAPVRLQHHLLSKRDRPTIPGVIFDYLKSDGVLRPAYGGEALWLAIENLWPTDQDHISVDTLWDWFASYPYLPKLLNRAVLEEAIKLAVRPQDLVKAPFFGFANSWDPVSKTYSGLVLGKTPVMISADALVVKASVAQVILEAQFAAEQAQIEETSDSGGFVVTSPNVPETKNAGSYTPAPNIGTTKKTSFNGSVEIDPERPIKSFDAIMNAVVYELQRNPGAKVRLTLSIEAESTEGFKDDDVGVVRDNAKSLKFKLDGDGFN